MLGVTAGSAAATAILLSLMWPNVYQSRTDFYMASSAQGLGMLSRAGIAAAASPLLARETEKWMTGVLESAAVRERVSRAVPRKSALELADDVDIDVTRYHIIRVSVRDRDPQLAATIANAYPSALRDFLRTTSIAHSQSTAEAIKLSRSELDQLLAQAQRKTERLLARQHSPSVQTEAQELLARKAALETDLEKSRARLDGIDQRIRVASEQLDKEGSRSSALSSQNQQRLMKDVSDLEAELAAARVEFDGKYAERYPKIRALEARLKQRQTELQRDRAILDESEVKPAETFYEQLRREILGLYKERGAVAAEIRSGTQSLSALAKRTGKLPASVLQEQEMLSNIRQLERMRDSLAQRDRDNRLATATQPIPIVVVAEAVPATAPKYPQMWLNAMVAALLGLIGGACLNWRENRDHELQRGDPRSFEEG